MGVEEEEAERQKEAGWVSSWEPVAEHSLARILRLRNDIMLIYVLIAQQQTAPACCINVRTKTISESALKQCQSLQAAQRDGTLLLA